jgi:hypothetical protein
MISRRCAVRGVHMCDKVMDLPWCPYLEKFPSELDPVPVSCKKDAGPSQSTFSMVLLRDSEHWHHAEQRLLVARASMSAVIATITTYVCSICGRGFGSAFSNCVKHVSRGRINQCRASGAQVVPVTHNVGRRDRNVGGRQSDDHMLHWHLTRTEIQTEIQITEAAAMTANQSLSSAPAILSQVIRTYPSKILSYPRDILLDIHCISLGYLYHIMSYPDISCCEIRTSGYFVLH